MNISLLEQHWYPLLAEKQLKDVPVAVCLLGQSLVLVRLQGQVLCFENRCPHRNVPLSAGKVVENALQCAYHGWRFDAQGLSPCHPEAKLKSYGLHCAQGLIWVRLKGNKPFDVSFIDGDGVDTLVAIKSMNANFIHSIENFLDPTHTPYVHGGVLRNTGLQRMQVSQQSDDSSFTTRYQLIDKQNGWINRLFDRGIDTQLASFHYPGLAQIRYLKQGITLFRVAIYFVPQQIGQVGMVVAVSLPRGRIPSRLKFMLLRPFLELAFKQDRKILEQQYKNQRLFNAGYIMAEQDLVIDHLLYLFKNGAKGKDKSLFMEL